MRKSFLYAQILCAMLGSVFGLAVTSQAQSGMLPRADGSNPASFSKKDQAILNEQDRLDKEATQALNAGQYALAVTDAQESYAMNHGDPPSPLIMAKALEAEGKTADAIKAYQIMIDTGDVQPFILMPYAELEMQQGDIKDALAAYEKSLPYVPFGRLLRTTSDFAFTTPNPAALEAAIHVARALVYGYGDVVTTQPQYDKALLENQKALALEPNWAVGDYYEGYTLKHMGRRSDAEAMFAKAAQLGDDSVKAAIKRQGG